MKNNMTGPNPGLIEKEYPYRYKWSATITVILSCGLGALGMFQVARYGGVIWWWLASIIFFVFFLWGLYIAVINLTGNRRFIIAKDEIYFPSLWKSETYSVISFAEIDGAQLFSAQGQTYLQLRLKNKKYASIMNTWLPSKDDFAEVLYIVSKRLEINQTNP